jgi:hypothetical protein
MMGIIENKQLMQNIFAGLAEGNSRPLVEAMAEDFSWTVIGRNHGRAHTRAGKRCSANCLRR